MVDLDDFVDPESKQVLDRIKELDAENQRLTKLLGLSRGANSLVMPQWTKLKKIKSSGKSCTAFAILSDLHLDEIVRPDELNGLNAFSRAIAEARLRRFVDHVRILAEREQAAGTVFDGLVLFSLGDTLTGWIHDELQAVGTEAPPTASLVYWAPLLARAIAELAEFFGRVVVVNEVGNHGRTTKRQWSKHTVETNYDWVIMEWVRTILESDDRIKWSNTLSPETRTSIYDTHILSFHGNKGVKGGGGISGVWPPLLRAQYKMSQRWANRGQSVDLIVLGHFHTWTPAVDHGFLINGSLKGPDEWSVGEGYPSRPAVQTFGVIHQDRGITSVEKVFVTSQDDEGW